MAIVFMDGLEDEGSHDRWGWTSDPTLITGPDSRGRAGQWTTGNPSASLTGFYDSAVGAGGHLGFRFRLDATSAGGMDELIIANWDSNQYWELNMDGGGNLQWYVNATTPQTTPLGSLNVGTWYYLEVMWDRTAAGTTRLIFAVNGVVRDDTVYNTYTADPGGSKSFTFYPTAQDQVDSSIDDFLFDDAFSATPWANVHVDRLLPNAAGALTDWGGAYTDVDDDDPTTSTGTSITSTTATDQTSYEMEDLPSTGNSVKAVMYEAWCQGTSNLEPLWRSSGGSVGVETTDVIGVPASYGLADVILEQNPQTATGWTVGDVNTGQFGVELA